VIRIFTTLAIIAVIALSITLIMGLSIDNLPELINDKLGAISAGKIEDAEKIQDKADVAKKTLGTHRNWGLGTAILVLLVNSVSVTYFVGTSRWCKEVGLTYQLPVELIERGQKIKHRNFPYAVVSMCAMVVVAMFGALADASIQETATAASWITPHFFAACTSIALMVFSFYMQALNIMQQSALIQEIMGQVLRIRTERGLD
jgi:hypothetical protein